MSFLPKLNVFDRITLGLYAFGAAYFTISWFLDPSVPNMFLAMLLTVAAAGTATVSRQLTDEEALRTRSDEHLAKTAELIDAEQRRRTQDLIAQVEDITSAK